MDRATDARDNVLDELAEIEEWSAQMTPLPSCHSNDDYMTIAVALMVRTTMLLTFAASLAPDETALRDGVTKRNAIVLGLLVRMRKLCHGLLMHVVEKQRDLCTIFDRLIIETETKMTYLMAARQSSFRHFVQISFRPEKEMLKDLKQKRATRRLLPIEKRMLLSVQRHLRDDRISAKWLLQNKTWDLDGKNFRQLFAALGREGGYSYGFAIGSHWVHGSWFDIKTYHLRKEGRLYKANLDYQIPDPRNICPVTIICLRAVLRYLKWARVDPDRRVGAIVRRVLTVSEALDQAHERSLQRRS
jgi:hypothetical protein